MPPLTGFGSSGWLLSALLFLFGVEIFSLSSMLWEIGFWSLMPCDDSSNSTQAAERSRAEIDFEIG